MLQTYWPPRRWRLRERYGLAPVARLSIQVDHLRGRRDGLTRVLARRVGSSGCATREGRGDSGLPNARAFHQPSNVRRTVPKHNSSGGFAVAQEADGLTIRQEQIRKVEHENFAVRDYVERLT